MKNQKLLKEENIMPDKNATPGKDGNLYVPYDKRTGEKSVVYFTRDLSPEGLKIGRAHV